VALIIVSAKADLSFPNVSIGNPVMCYSEHRFRLKACRNDIVLAETMTKAENVLPMIYFLVSRSHAYTMSSFLAFRGKHLASRIRILSYEDLFWKKYLNRGAYIFSDLERLTPEGVRQATKLHDALCQGPRSASILNHPASSLTRYALLRKLFVDGVNPFNVYRADEARVPKRFPVFLRRENDHEGSITVLLNNQGELIQALDAIERSGIRLSNILIVEYCDTRKGANAYKKYSVFKFGDHLVARHMFTSYDWVIKDPEQSIGNPETELIFVKQNPHGQMLYQIFQKAGIDYGRVDYSILDGKPVIWEINTNPMIATSQIADREEVEQYFIAEFSKAVASLDSFAISNSRIVNPLYLPWAKRGQEFMKHIVKSSPIPVHQKLYLREYYKRFTATK